MDRETITQEEIEAAKSPKGGFTRKTLEQWGVPWPPPKGWRTTIVKHGIPYDDSKNQPVSEDPEITQEALQKMMNESVPQMVSGEPQDCEGDLDIDPAQLLRKVVTAVISAGQAEILWEFPEVLAFFGSRIPEPHEVANHHKVDQRMFEAKAKWPNRKS